jgi:outer membrane receptor protein involved in Fe transport
MKRYSILFAIFLIIPVSLYARTGMDKQNLNNDSNTQPDSLLIDQYELEGVIISAEKRESKIMDVPVSATAISSLAIKNERIISTADLTGPVPNLYMPDYGSKLTSPVYIRGIGSRINAPSVGFYMDEVALFEKASFNFDMYDIQRIEVLRGPQGTLYGRNTMGGIVHVITRDPGNRLDLRLLGEIGNYGQQQYQLRVGNPIVKDKLFIQLSGNFRKRNGFFTNQFTGEQVDHLNTAGGRVKLIFKPSQKSKITWQFFGDLSDEGGYPYALVPEEGNDLLINYDHESTYRREVFGTSLQFEKRGSRINLNSITAFQDLRGFQDIDQDFTPADLLTVTQDQDQQLITQEIRISNSDPSDRLIWIAGIYGFYQANYQEVGVTYGEDGISRFRLPYNTYSYVKQNDMSNHGAALFGQSTLKEIAINNLDITLGIRVDYEKNGLDYNYDRFVDGEMSHAEDFVSSNEFFEILPKISFKYKWSESQMNYISLTRGYKSGGFNTTFEREEDRAFDPEYSWNYEAGWKASFSNKKLNLGLALFYIDWKNLQVYQPIPSGRGSMLKNAASAYSRGAELEISGLPVRNWKISGSLGYSDARFTEFFPDPEEAINYNGNKIPYVPDLTGFVTTSYRIPLSGKLFNEVAMSVNWRQTGKIYWNDANEYVQNPYGLMGANVMLGISDFSLRIWSQNILNTSYRAFQFTAIGNVYTQPGRPRTTGITLSYNL